MERKQQQGRVEQRPWVVADREVGVRLDVFLASPARLGSRGRASRALERGQVFLNDQEVHVGFAAYRLAPGDRVRLWVDRPGSARVRNRPVGGRDGRLQIVYEDAELVVVNKPAGLLAVPLARRSEAPSVASLLTRHLRTRGKRTPLVVHRIDRDTSGLVVFATDAGVWRRLKAQFARREPERVYLAVVRGVPDPPVGSWRDVLVWDQRELAQRAAADQDPRGRDSQCEYAVLERFPAAEASLIRVALVTGRRNQIRVQAQLHGHPLLGERMYAEVVESGDAASRQALHAWRLAFRHPNTGERLCFEAPYPADFESLLARLRSIERYRTSGQIPQKKSADPGTVPARQSSYRR
ncbi:MAG: pseudouridine synthase [Vicinamibacterales bacterium]